MLNILQWLSIYESTLRVSGLEIVDPNRTPSHSHAPSMQSWSLICTSVLEAQLNTISKLN